MYLLAPVNLRDLISVSAKVERVGRTSMSIRIEVVATRDRGTTDVKVTEGDFTFVALDDQHRPRAVDSGWQACSRCVACSPAWLGRACKEPAWRFLPRERLGYCTARNDAREVRPELGAGRVVAWRLRPFGCVRGGIVTEVCGTEPLAVGINMPGKTVVYEKLSKITGDHHQFLPPGEYTQLTGRAGRRGLDDLGHAVVLWSPFVPFDQVAALAGSPNTGRAGTATLLVAAVLATTGAARTWHERPLR